ncbi:uncharacterized protein PAC_01063 [Phialocephala subalpina]|uniref:Uncharacterized protein n=1 Tax=Phialocephala subalpina TaxID=576137 RepID=A0A1L7WEN1_9HELO|nr:uncharacterized protein PAC_01063 [Phialocephala subalpina]
MAEGLQIAQIIADLQSLQSADPTAASTLLSAQKSPRPSLPSQPNPRRKSSSAIPLSSPQNARFDKLGRRIVVPRSNPGTATPPSLPRSASSFSRFDNGNVRGNGGSTYTSRTGSGVGTPVEETPDEDMKRAKTLLELFEMRGKFKQMGDTGLTRAKQRVDNVVEKYAKMELEEREKAAKARHLGA